MDRARASSAAIALPLGLCALLGCGGAQPAGAGHRSGTTAAAEPATERTETSTGPGFTLASLAEGATLLPDLGTLHREVTTASPEAQAFFDQGLRLTYGFNHDEAARSFARGGAIDPSCAMCFWGAAYTLGPNYNIPMLPDRSAAAWDALERARTAIAGGAGTPAERALIEALARRYAGPAYLDPPAMQPHVEAYASAMREVARAFPDDLDVQVLAAEAAMNVRPWRLWEVDGSAAPGTDEIVATLESVLARDATHPGANHYYIHAIEASPTPERAVPSADRLAALMPGAGHVVHMPAHIYQRVGRYRDASAANLAAIDADRRYLAAVTPPGYYPFYLAHNYGFLAYSASMEGRSAEALDASRRSAESMPRDVVCGMPGMDFFLSEPLLVMVRFGKWDELLAEPAPIERHAVHFALFHHARGMALAARDRIGEARRDLETVERLSRELPEDLLAGLNAGRTVLELAAKVLEARIAERTASAEAIGLWEQAVAIEDRLAYNEPADWFYPTRHYLGAALLDAGRAADAEAIYRADLERNPANGWSLFGLARAQRAQRRARDAAATERQLREAWARADIALERSAL
jgi:tetratricopeptide (TPR) repeat protein